MKRKSFLIASFAAAAAAILPARASAEQDYLSPDQFETMLSSGSPVVGKKIFVSRKIKIPEGSKVEKCTFVLDAELAVDGYIFKIEKDMFNSPYFERVDLFKDCIFQFKSAKANSAFPPSF